MKTVGFIGTGGMGSGMAANLIKAGYRLVVNDLNRVQAKALEAQGAEFKDSPKAVAMLGAVQHMAIVEIGAWLGKSGLDNATFKTILEKSQWDSSALRRIMEILVSRKFKPRKSWMPKDVGFGLDMAREMEVPMPFTALAYQMFSIAQATGMDGYEATGIACNVFDLITGQKKGI